MRYAVEYNRNFRHLKDVNEIILPYKGVGDNIVAFVEDNFKQEQKIIIAIDSFDISEDDTDAIWIEEKAIPQINMLRHEGWNIVLKIPMLDEFINPAKENEIPFIFFNFAKTIEDIYIHAGRGASDVYVVESLGFSMDKIKKAKNELGVNIRVYPNIAQCGKGGNDLVPAIKKFWIRPEDTEFYEDVVDVFEILGGEDQSRLSVVYEIYKQRQWMGDLKTLILDFKDSVPNTGLTPHFGEMRFNCDKKCLYSTCNLCTQMVTLAYKFDEEGIRLIKKRQTPEITEEEKEKILDTLRSAEDGSGINETVMPT